MEWSAANGFIMASPVRVVDKILPKQPGKRERVEHHPALPWRMMPEFFADVLHKGPASLTKLMLELLILTAGRSGEIRKMRWNEINFDDALWAVPAERMKRKVLHRVPLGPRAMEILERQHKRRDAANDLVFSSRNDTPPSDMILTTFLRKKKVPSDLPGRFATAHGFRSSFRDWASENGYARDSAERALSHAVKNTVEAAYHRTDLLEKRRLMMAAWEDFCLGRG